MKKVFIATSTFAQYDSRPLYLLKKAGLSYVFNTFGRKLAESEIKNFIADTECVIAGTEPYTKSVLKSAKKLKVISRCGAGLDNIDMGAVKEFGIKVFNTPDAPALAVAELTVALVLCLLRKISLMDRKLRNGIWRKEMGNLLQAKRIGIIGMGRIGRKVAELLRGFNCDMAYADPYTEDGILGLKQVPLKNLLKWADVVTLHISNGGEVLGEEQIGKMKKGSWLINVSRGGAVNEDSLYRYLKNGHLSGAAIDVFNQEPYEGPLKELNNVILTPHIGSYAQEARIEMEIQSVKNLLGGMEVCS